MTFIAIRRRFKLIIKFENNDGQTKIDSRMLCISRVTDDSYAQQFGNGRNKFYIEFRCNLPCSTGKNVCDRCSDKSSANPLQTSRRFNHGNVNEPIPDASHIYGGKWYLEGVKKYGSPSYEVIEFAKMYQNSARSGLVDSIIEPEIEDTTVTIVKKRRGKPRVIEEVSQQQPVVEPVVEPVNPAVEPVKRKRRPKVIEEEKKEESEFNEQELKKQIVIVKKTPSQRKTPPSAVTNPYTALIAPTSQLVHKEVTLPTHIESTIEELDTEGYEIEYVNLQVFEVGQATYFRDSTKNKLYRKIKEKGIGAYVGRWNPDTETIHTDIPDSDDEAF